MWPASHHAQAGLTYTPKNEINADARIVRRIDNTSSREEGLKIGPSFAFRCDEPHVPRTAPWMWASGQGGHVKRRVRSQRARLGWGRSPGAGDGNKKPRLLGSGAKVEGVRIMRGLTGRLRWQ